VHNISIKSYVDLEEEGEMDKKTIETSYLPKSFKKVHDCITKILKQHGDEEDKQEDKAMER
jgi:hypothetical protein